MRSGSNPAPADALDPGKGFPFPAKGPIIGGLMAALILGIFLLPTLYVWVAGERDVLPEAEVKAEEE